MAKYVTHMTPEFDEMLRESHEREGARREFVSPIVERYNRGLITVNEMWTEVAMESQKFDDINMAHATKRHVGGSRSDIEFWGGQGCMGCASRVAGWVR